MKNDELDAATVERCAQVAKPVAWIEFADNGNIRFWTSDPARAWTEGDNGRPLRKFTLAELIALAASPRLDREKVAATFKAAFDRAYMNAADEETAQDLAIEAGIDAIMRETR